MNLLRALPRLAVMAGALALGTSALASDIRVLSAGALKPLVQQLAPAFERETGHRLVIGGDTAGALVKKVEAGEAFDLLIVTQAGAEQLAKAARVAPDSVTPVARVGIGAAARQGAPRPDIATLAGFRQALVESRSVAHIDPGAGGSSGIYLVGLFEKMGIADEMKRKAVLVPGGLTAERLLDGRADLALQQMSELMVVPGVVVLGPIPAEVQNYTVYSAAVSSQAGDAAAARAFLARLGSAQAREAMTGKGMEAPAAR